MYGAAQCVDAMCFSDSIRSGDGSALLLWSGDFIKPVQLLQDHFYHTFVIGRVLVTHRTLLVGLRNSLTQIRR